MWLTRCGNSQKPANVRAMKTTPIAKNTSAVGAGSKFKVKVNT